MFWRLLSALAILFWAVMAALLVRDTYFPHESTLSEVPPRYVFDLFLKQASQQAVTLHLHHRGEKIGHASMSITGQKSSPISAPEGYELMARGLIERLQENAARMDITWEISGRIDTQGEWSRAEFLSSMQREKVQARVFWEKGQKLPAVSVTQDGRSLIDPSQLGILTALSGGMIGKSGGLGALAGVLGPLAGMPAADTSTATDEKTPAAASETLFTAHEATVEMAGRERKCFIVTMPLVAGQSARLLFAETGELARIELPQEYVLLEPMIHGMFQP